MAKIYKATKQVFQLVLLRVAFHKAFYNGQMDSVQSKIQQETLTFSSQFKKDTNVIRAQFSCSCEI